MSGDDLPNLSVKKGRDYHGLYYIEGAPFRISFWTYGADIDAEEAQRRLDFANELVAVWNSRQSAEAASRAEVKRLRHALKMISIVDQGCGGTLTFREMAESAMRQARAAITPKEPDA